MGFETVCTVGRTTAYDHTCHDFQILLWRCSDTDRPVGPGLPIDRPGPGGLKGRGTLDEPGRSRRYAPRARESVALPVTQAEREPPAPSGSRRRAPTTARDRRSLGPLARQRRARTPQGATRPRSVVRKTRMRLSSLREIEDFPLAVRTRCVLTTSRESSALSNDSESWESSVPRAFWTPESLSEHYPYYGPTAGRRRAAGRRAPV